MIVVSAADLAASVAASTKSVRLIRCKNESNCDGQAGEYHLQHHEGLLGLSSSIVESVARIGNRPASFGRCLQIRVRSNQSSRQRANRQPLDDDRKDHDAVGNGEKQFPIHFGR